MKILVVFMTSVLPNYNHGGSTKILKDIALYLAKHGDEVSIVCNQRSDNTEPFLLAKHVKVFPILHFKETFPDPYATPPFFIAAALAKLYELSLEHDVIFIFDSNFLFTDIFPKDKPLILSLRDFLYSEALQGSFLMRRGRMIVNSLFVYNSLLATAGRGFPDIKSRTTLIANGIDLNLFQKKPSSHIKQLIGLNKDDFPVLLFPHRPEWEKGIEISLQATQRLIQNFGFSNTKLLITKGIDEKISPEIKSFYRSIEKKARALKIEQNVVFHPWLHQKMMPEYYSQGTVTLCLGNVVEAFGSNTALESLACGTPVVASRVAGYRTTLPEWCISKVDAGDTNAAARAIVDIVTGKKIFPMSQIREYISKTFSVEEMCKSYYLLLHEPCKDDELMTWAPEDSTLHPGQMLDLAPWVYLSKKGLYNDYLKTYRRSGILINFFQMSSSQPFSVAEATKFGLTIQELLKEIDNGYLIRHLQ